MKENWRWCEQIGKKIKGIKEVKNKWCRVCKNEKPKGRGKENVDEKRVGMSK